MIRTKKNTVKKIKKNLCDDNIYFLF